MSEIITLESDDECESAYSNNRTVTASILNERPIDICSMIASSHSRYVNGIGTNGLLSSSTRTLNGTNRVHVQNGHNVSPLSAATQNRVPTMSRRLDQPTFNLVQPNTNRLQIFVHAEPLIKKPRLVTATPVFIPKKNGLLYGTQSKIRQLSENYLEAYPTAGQNERDDEFPGQFKCTYNNCGKHLRNNVTFMYHLWAHVIRQKPYVEEDVTNLQLTSQSNATFDQPIKDDVNRLRTCPECLLIQPSPHRMHLHYHRVHKFDKLLSSQDLAICNICESVCQFANMDAHLQRHGDADLPYHCRKCRYRTSAREALFRHFLENHCGTSMCLCPFCLVSFNIPLSERLRPSVVMNSYVQHMMDHDIDFQQGCQQCVTRFQKGPAATASDRHEKHHLRQHNPTDKKWKIVRKHFVSLQRPQSKALVPSSDVQQTCLECGHVIADSKKMQPNLKDLKDTHFKELKKCRARHCSYESYCTVAFELHSALSSCIPENEHRWPLGKPLSAAPKNNGVKDTYFKCEKCDFDTIDSGAITKHLATSRKCNGAKAKIEKIADIDKKLLKRCEQEQKAMIEHFGLDHLNDIDPIKYEQEQLALEQEDDEMLLDEISEKLSMIVPNTKVEAARANKNLIKHLFGQSKVSIDLEIICSTAVGDIKQNIKQFRDSVKDN
ncbi:zinc finger protein [Ditylenchus destructor]|nr:zinc finger protein [Ditylenchus destructor]